MKPVKKYLRLAARKYEQGGISRVLTGAARHIWLGVTLPLYEPLASYVADSVPVVGREELLDEVAAQSWRFGSTQRFTIASPDTDTRPSQFATMEGTYEIDQPFVCEVTNGTVLGTGGVTVTPAGILLETAENSNAILQSRLVSLFREHGILSTMTHLRDRTVVSPDYEVVFPMLRHPSVNYYHWILGYLGRIRALETYREYTDVNPRVLVNPNQPSWVTESMRLTGFNLEDAITMTDDELTAERVVVPVHRTRYYDQFEPSPAECQFLADRIKSNLPPIDRDRFSSRVYVSRQDADTRRVLNEPELLRTLTDYGFERYELTSLSFAEQVALFSQADVVMGPHGAGLVNLVFAADPTVVEFLPRTDPRAEYFGLTAQLGYDYEYLLCEADGSDMRVDVDEVRSVIEDELQSSETST